VHKSSGPEERFLSKCAGDGPTEKSAITLKPNQLHSSRKPQLESSLPPSRSRWLRRPYLGRQTQKLAKELKKYNYQIGFYPLLTISSLINLKDPIPRNRRSGIYKLTCDICDAQYIGQTERAFAVRLSEHRTAFNTQKAADSAMAEPIA